MSSPGGGGQGSEGLRFSSERARACKCRLASQCCLGRVACASYSCMLYDVLCKYGINHAASNTSAPAWGHFNSNGYAPGTRKCVREVRRRQNDSITRRQKCTSGHPADITTALQCDCRVHVFVIYGCFSRVSARFKACTNFRRIGLLH